MSALRTTFLFAFLALSLRAHVVEQFFVELQEPAPAWRLEVLFDVGYAKPEWRGDPDSPPPTREWLVERTADEHAAFRAETERFLRECLGFHHGEEAAEVSYHFPDFDSSPPDFTTLLTGGAYYRVRIEPETPGSTRVWTAATDGPDFVFQVSDPETGEAGFVTLSPGESMEMEAPEFQSPLVEGFRHVIPLGLDHVLFILALFLLERRFRPLLAQSLTFTLAHTFTLGLTASGIIRPSDHIIEPLIALSIAALAIENLFVKEFRPWRYATVFAFGLLHGMGFGNVLAPILLAGDGFLSRLIATNIGVELAQVTILLAAWVLTLKWHDSEAYPKVRMTANLAIAATALFWLVERVS